MFCFDSLRFMMTSLNGNIFRVTGLCVGNSPVTGEFPLQKPVTRSFDVFFDPRLGWTVEYAIVRLVICHHAHYGVISMLFMLSFLTGAIVSNRSVLCVFPCFHDDIITWNHFPHYWPFVTRNPPVYGGFPSERAVMGSFDVLLPC